jgi:thiamine pyrophosphokinase
MSEDATERTREAVVLDSSFLDPNLPSKKRSDGDAYADFDSNLDPVLIILNHNLPRLTAALWRRARLVVVADGGADRLLEASSGWEEAFGSLPSSSSRRRPPRRSGDDGGGTPSSLPLRSSFLPDFIVGDLDSISPQARLHFGSLGVPIIDLSTDQDSTDLQKCLGFAAAEVEKQQKERGSLSSPPPSSSTSSSSPSLPASPSAPPVFVAGALGGRLDHSLSAISTLYAIDAARRRKEGGKEEEEGKREEEEEEGFAAAAARSLGDVVLSGDGSLARLVPASCSSSSEPCSSETSKVTTTATAILPCAAVEGPGCGLVALGAAARGVETSGLEWNLSLPAGKGRTGKGGAAEEGEGGSPALEMGGLQSTSNSILEGGRVTVTSTAPLLWTTTLREEWR